MLITAGCAVIATAWPPQPPAAPLGVGNGERLLVIAPHPDDEILGAAGLIQRVREHAGSVDVVLVTAGDGNVGGVVLETGLRQPPAAQFVAYGERRVREARAAIRRLSVGEDRLTVLGFPDGGLLPLLSRHWWRAHPARSPTTGATDPPYAFVSDPDVRYDGADLRDELVRVIERVQPTVIALPDPLDRHPDHHATAILALLAIDAWLGGRWPHHEPPRVLGYLVHWPDWPPGWNGITPTAEHGELRLPPTLPARPLATATLQLRPIEVAAKAAALAEHASQERAMGTFLSAFVRGSEPFTLFDAVEIRRVGRDYERAEPRAALPDYSTVTLFARLRGWSMSRPSSSAA
jgi:LmbE family N-acetylglucosaminyl deacetylase